MTHPPSQLGRQAHRRRYLWNTTAKVLVVGVLAYAMVSGLPACTPKSNYGYVSTSLFSHLQKEPAIRVRIAKDKNRVQFSGPSRLRITLTRATPSDNAGWTLPTPVTVTRQPGRFLIQPAGEAAFAWAKPVIAIEPTSRTKIRVDGVPYPHRLILHANSDKNGSTDRFDIVNHLPMEDYLPGVLQKELYKSWSPAAFRAQAIAARSYAISHSAHNRKRHFDLESTTASQAYAGATAHRRARKAVQQTQGIVLTYQNHILPAYYSSCCGGIGQSAADAFPTAPNIPPLRGRNHGGWCAASHYFRWGPIKRNRTQLTQRLATWGQSRQHPIAALKDLVEISVAKHNPNGRPIRFTVADTSGQLFALTPESFRIACNYESPNLPQLPKGATLKSSHVNIQINGQEVLFTGRGYGHGVGMCQWGAQGMAQRGYDEATILGFYYPGAILKRAY